MPNDEVFDSMRAAMRDEGQETVADDNENEAEAEAVVPEKMTAVKRARTPATDKPRAQASFDMHELGEELPADAPKAPNARDLLLGNMEACKEKPGTWFVIATYAGRKTAEATLERICDGKQPVPEGEFEVEVRSPQVGGVKKHIVAAKFIG